MNMNLSGLCALVAGMLGETFAWAQDAPFDQPNIRLVAASGTLCSDDSVSFDASSGAFTVVLSRDLDTSPADLPAEGLCHLELRIDVQEGWTFTRPSFAARVFSANSRPAHVSFVYSWRDYNGNMRADIFNYAIKPDAEGVNYTLTQRPNIISPTCEKSTSFTLKLDMVAQLMSDSYIEIQSLDADFTSALGGTTWYKCPASCEAFD